MNTEIQTFNFHNNPVRTLTDENGDPWFVAKDVCDILGIDTNHLREALDDDEITNLRNSEVWNQPGRAPLIISEPGLYKLIMRSRKPEAKTFQRWVTHEVLPQIRRTGGYIPTTDADDDMTILAKAVLVAQKTIDLKNQQLLAKDARIKELEPKAQALDAFINVEDRLLIRDAAKVLSNAGTPITEKQLREWMADNGWIYKANCSWHATAKHCTTGHLVMVMSQAHVTKADGTKFAYPPTVRITRKGLALLHKRLGETILNETLKTTTH
ncbi:MAG: antirepressor protein KilAC domain [Namikivirus ozawa]|uniref:Antirepressor protein KilAC domain n=1 Tax=Bacteriophage sp. TaxID=38018 RepID=A0ABY5TRS5_9VIRU|nr:MAG: antirepressor protein KilAC domain [Bacteriophage sp.]